MYSFTFTAADGTFTSNTATVTITVTDPVNRPPVATNDTATVDEDGSATFDPRSNDTDADNDPLAIVGTTPAGHGSVTCSATSCTYTPAANYNGTDSFIYTLSDGRGGTTLGTVDLTVDPVNDAPVANIDTVTTTEGVATAVNVVANDADIDGDSLSVASNTQPAHGTATCGVTSCSYVPAPAFDGPDFFNYTVSDGNGGTATTTVNITVTSLNEAPAATLDVTPASATAPALVTATLGGTDPTATR